MTPLFRWTKVQLPLLKQGAPTKLGVERCGLLVFYFFRGCLYIRVFQRAGDGDGIRGGSAFQV
jgi:hypothetical protein